MRQIKVIPILLLSLFLISISYLPSSASWYVGNRHSRARGLKATISTPSSAPYLASSGKSSWVSLPSPTWIQAGWRFYKGWSKPQRYVEYLDLNNVYDDPEFGDHEWNTTVEYRGKPLIW
jgi:hypothetical protein